MTEQVPALNSPQFSLHRAFLKGASLEIPGLPEVFQLASPPHVHVDLGVTVTRGGGAFYEVVVRATVALRSDEQPGAKTLVVLEVDQAGVFEVANVTDEQLTGLLEVAAPTILTPYLRVAISDIMTRATLPPFYLPEINWVAVREQHGQAKPAPSLSVVH